MHIALSRRDVGVTHQLLHDHQILGFPESVAAEGVTKIMPPKISDLGRLQNPLPVDFKAVIGWADPWSFPFGICFADTAQDRERFRAKRDFVRSDPARSNANDDERKGTTCSGVCGERVFADAFMAGSNKKDRKQQM